MNQRERKRRISQAVFYDAIVDRRSNRDRRGQVAHEALMPGAVRPGPGEVVFRERRRFPESGME